MSREIQQSNKAPRHHNDNFESDKRFIETVAELRFNPLRSLKVDNDLVYNRLLSSNYININPIEGLNLRSTFSIDYAQKQQNKYTPNDIYESERYGTQGEAKDDRDTRTVWQWDNSLSYEVSFGKHKLNAMVGTSATRTTYNYGEFYQFNLSSCIRQQNSLTAQFVSFSLSNLANIFYPPNFYNN